MKIKKLLLLFFINCFLIGNMSFAQKQVNEATILYKISIESSDSKVDMSKSSGATLAVSLKGSQSRTDMVSSLGTESNIFDSQTGKGTILKQYSGQKLMITLNRENWAQNNRFYQNMKFNIDNTVQSIAGYNCKKATGQSADGKTLTVYFTPDIILSNKQYDNAFAQLPGLPVQYELQSGKLTFKYLLTSLNYEPIPSSKFEFPKSGFRIMSYEENQQLKKEGK